MIQPQSRDMIKPQLKTCFTQQGRPEGDGVVSKASLKDASEWPVKESMKNLDVQDTSSDYQPSESSQDDDTFLDDDSSMLDLEEETLVNPDGTKPVPMIELIDSFIADFKDVDFNERVNAQLKSLKHTLIKFRRVY